MSVLKNILWLLISFTSIALGAWIVIDNPNSVVFKIFGLETSPLPSGLWLLGSFSAGCIVSLLVSSLTLVKLNYRLRKVRKQLAKTESSIASTKEEK